MARFIIDIDSTEEGLSPSEVVQVLETKYSLITCFKIDKNNINQFHEDWLMNDITTQQILEYRSQLAQNFIDNEGFWGVFEYLCQEGWNISSEHTLEDIEKIKFKLQENGYDLQYTETSASITLNKNVMYTMESYSYRQAVYYVLFKLIFIIKPLLT